MTRPYDTSNRPRRTAKASGARGWYDIPEWKARSKAHLERNPYCVSCGDRRRSATTSRRCAWTIARACCAGRSCRCAGRATAEFQAILDQCPVPWCLPRSGTGPRSAPPRYSLSITPAPPKRYWAKRPR
jgi:hypothetical protein